MVDQFNGFLKEERMILQLIKCLDDNKYINKVILNYINNCRYISVSFPITHLVPQPYTIVLMPEFLF